MRACLSLIFLLTLSLPAEAALQKLSEIELHKLSQEYPVDVAVDTTTGRTYSLGWRPHILVFDEGNGDFIASSNILPEARYAWPLHIFSDGRGMIVALFYAWDSTKNTYGLAVCLVNGLTLQRRALYWAGSQWPWGAALDGTGRRLGWTSYNQAYTMDLQTGQIHAALMQGLPGYPYLYVWGVAFDSSRESLWMSGTAYRKNGWNYERRSILAEASLNPPHASLTHDMGAGWGGDIWSASPGRILYSDNWSSLSLIETQNLTRLWRYDGPGYHWLTRASPLLDGKSLLTVHNGWGSYTATLLDMETGMLLVQRSQQSSSWWPLSAVSHKRAWALGVWGWPSFLDRLPLDSLMLEKRINLAPAHPWGISLDDGRGRGFVASASGGIFELDLFQKKARRLDTVLPSGFEIDNDPVSQRLFVTHPWRNQISVVDTAQERLITTLQPGGTPRDVAFSPEANYLSASYNIYSCPLAIYKGSTLERTGTAATGGWPAGVVISSSGFAYVADMWDGKVRKVRLTDSQVIASYGAGSYPERLALDERRGLLTVTNRWGSSGLTILNLATGLAEPSIATGGYPIDVALRHKTGRAYVLNDYPPGLSVVSLSSRMALERIPLPGGYYFGRVAVDQTSGLIYVTDYYNGRVHVFEDSVPLDSEPPEIQHFPFESAQPDTQALKIQARIKDASLVLASLYGRESGSSLWWKKPMSLIQKSTDLASGNLYEAVIDASYIQNIRTKKVDYFITAVDEVGNGPAFSGTQEAPHAFSVLDLTPPKPPSLLKASVDASGKIFLSWTLSPSLDVDLYQIFIEEGAQSGPVPSGADLSYTAVHAVASFTSAGWSGHIPRGFYLAGLRALDVAGNSDGNTAVKASAIVVPVGESIKENLRALSNFSFGKIYGGFYRMIPGPSAAISDIRPDLPGLEVATGNEEYYPLGTPGPSGRWFLFDKDGNVIWWKDTQNDEAHSSIVLGDINGDRKLEMAGGTTSGNEVQLFDPHGNWIWRNPYNGHVLSTPAMEDGVPEREGKEVYAGSFDGTVKCLDGSTGEILWKYPTGLWIWSSPAVADLDGDGKKEVVVAAAYGSKGSLYCLDAKDGSLRWRMDSGYPMRASPLLADLDGDGILEVAIGSYQRFFILDGRTGSTKVSLSVEGSIDSSPVAADLDGDGKLEILFGTSGGPQGGLLYCLEGTGSLRWSLNLLDSVYNSAAVAKNHATGKMEIYVASSKGYLWKLGAQGNVLDLFRAASSVVSSPVLGDVDGDGKLEIFFQDRFADINNMTGDKFWRLRDLSSSVLPYRVEWGMFRANPAHTGIYSPYDPMMDVTPPISSILGPPDGSLLASLPTLSGTASDAQSGVKTVEVAMKNLATGVTGPWSVASGATSWIFVPKMLADGQYEILSRAYDESGNIEIPSAGPKFILDTTPPYSSVTSPLDSSFYTSAVTISGTASDAQSPLSKVEVSIKDETTIRFWNGNTWVDSESWVKADGLEKWSYTPPVESGHSYFAKSRAFDTAGNMESPYNLNGDTWTTKAPMPTARNEAATGALNRKLYAVGGSGIGGYLPTLEVYDPATDTWATKSSMPTGRSTLAACVIDGRLYAVGGYRNTAIGGTPLSVLEVYDPATDTWTQKASMFTARSALAAGVINGKLYAVGGNKGNLLSTLEVYDPATDSWTQKASMFTARDYLAAEVIDRKLYVVGGRNSSLGNEAILEVYDPATDTWTKKASMPTARHDLATTAMGGKLYAAGGYNGNPLSMLEVYDPVTDAWTTKAPMLAARYGQAADVINGRLYVAGGYRNGELSTLEVYTPSQASGGVRYSYKIPSETIAVSTQTTQTSTEPTSSTLTTATVSTQTATADSVVAVQTASSGTAHAEFLTPKAGKRLRGNAVTLLATASTDTARVLFQYRASSQENWHDIFSDSRAPFAVYWNLSGLSNGEYDLRALAFDTQGRPDRLVQVLGLFLDDVNVDITEDGNPFVDPNQAHVKKERIISSQDSLVAVVDGTQVFVPSGTLSSNDILILEDLSTKDLSSELGLARGLSSAGVLRRLQFSSGLKKFPGPVQITFPFSDEDGDGIVDGTSLTVSDLRLFYLEEDSSGKPLRWLQVPSQLAGSSVKASPVFPGGNQVVAHVDHFTLFGLFAQVPPPSAVEIPFALGEAYIFPNPARGSQNPIFHIEVGEADEVEVFIYDVSGALVETLRTTASPQTINGTLAYEIPWTPTASGVYVAVIQARKSGQNDIRLSRKFGVIR